MLIIDTRKDINTGVWREYRPGVRAKIRPLTRSVFRRLQQEAATKETVTERGRRAVTQTVDPERFDRLLYRHIIEDWEGFASPDGQPLPCTDEMKDIVCDRLGAFAAWAMEEAGLLAEQEDEVREEALKN